MTEHSLKMGINWYSWGLAFAISRVRHLAWNPQGQIGPIWFSIWWGRR